jgi:hypothetical protein
MNARDATFLRGDKSQGGIGKDRRRPLLRIRAFAPDATYDRNAE